MSTPFKLTPSGRMPENRKLKASNAELVLRAKYEETKNLRAVSRGSEGDNDS